MEILFPDDVYSGGGTLPQYFNDLGPSIIVRESNLHTFGSEKLKQERDLGCLPFTTNSRKFLSGCKW